MGHLQDVEAELRERLAKDDSEAVVAWVKEKILESYRNGQKARGAPRHGNFRRSPYAKRGQAVTS